MAQYEIEVDSQDEYYEDAASVNHKASEAAEKQKPAVRSVVKRKGRVFSAEEPSTQVLGGIKHFDTIKEEFSGRSLRCKIASVKILIYPLYLCFSCRRLGNFRFKFKRRSN